ncbi:NtaA/DmoA family FMN-dependent monooxygenase [Microbacterium terregens]|uniref:NtaA/DmoA family FMN-dependent monooxygenase n=1 Tax=Microbacterium terregens TaxID=69363 RepID=A0ABV5T2V6_9MICO
MTEPRHRQMILTMFMLSFGYHSDAWRQPNSRSEEVSRLSIVADMAKAAEAAKLHAIFFADSNDAGSIRANSVRGVSVYEPISTLSALIGHTSKIGLLGTASTTYSQPYSVARQFAGLDLLSDGRAGWNVVTSVSGNRNFGMEVMPAPEDRYRRATEFVHVVKALWDSWDVDAIVNDRERAIWVESDRVHDIDHVGEFFSVKGALNMPRPPQGHPLIVQAGQSPAGIQLGSSVADAIYTIQPDLDKAISFYDDYKKVVRSKGRDAEKVKILPGIMPFVGRTLAEAQDLAADLANGIEPTAGRAVVSGMLDVDISDLEMTDRIPLDRLVDSPERQERWRIYRGMAESMTVGELMVELARAVGHRWMIGTPSTIADSMIEWFDRRACDGFNLNPPSFPDGMDAMLTLLVPELQERGYFQADYTGDTLRERMGAEAR